MNRYYSDIEKGWVFKHWVGIHRPGVRIGARIYETVYHTVRGL